MISPTSLIAYKKIADDLPESRLKVYKALKHLEYATCAMLSKYLNKPMHHVSGRITELKKMGLIKISHVSWCPVTKNKAHYLTLIKFDEEEK